MKKSPSDITRTSGALTYYRQVLLFSPGQFSICCAASELLLLYLPCTLFFFLASSIYISSWCYVQPPAIPHCDTPLK